MIQVKSGLNKVAIGLGFMIAAVMLLCLAFLAPFSIALAPSIGVGIGTIAVTALSSLITAGILAIAGPVMCLGAPAETRSGEIMTLAIALQVVLLLINPLSRVVTIPFVILQVLPYLGIVPHFLFVFFLKRIAVYLDRPELIGLVQSVLILAGITAAVSAFLYAAIQIKHETAALVLTLVVFAVGIWAFLRYLRSLVYVRRAIAEHLKKLSA